MKNFLISREVKNMSNFYNEINKLTEDIVKHRVNEIQVEERINRLKKRYGEDAFPSFNFEKNPQLWSKSYLLELKEKNVTGAYSEEFLLYMAEVSDYLAKRKKRTLIMVVSMLTVSFTILINVRTYSSQIIKKLYNLIKKKKTTMFDNKKNFKKK